ncbi:hypothetical protein DEU37_0213 [Microbacterium sp. AG790]|nr:hypothetical protein DEU37_0213 [Microbacterium sp. AG790]
MRRTDAEDSADLGITPSAAVPSAPYAGRMTTPQYPQPAAQPGPQPMNPSDEKMWATLVHVGGIFYFLPSLIGYLVLKDRGPFVRAHTAAALNFQLTMLIASLVGTVLSIIGIGLVILLAVYVVNIVFSIIAAVKASRGEWYTYPLSISFVS